MKLSTKLSLIIGTSATVFMTVAGITTFRSYLKALQDTVGENQLLLAKSTMREIDRQIYEAILNIEAIAEDEGIETAIAKGEGKGLKKELKEKKLLTGPWDTLFITDTQGNVIVDTQTKLENENITKNKYFEKALVGALSGKTYYSDVEHIEPSNSPTLIIAAPIRDEQTVGSPIVGVVVGGYAWPVITEVLEQLHPLSACLLDKDLNIVSESQNIDDVSRHKFIARYYKDLLKKEGKHLVVKTPEVESTLISHTPQQGHLTYKGNSWTLLIGHNTSEAFGNAYKTAISGTLIVVALLAGFVASIAFLMFRLVTNPISKLTKTVNAITKGDTKARAQIKSKDELGILAKSFNEMTDKLQEAYSSIEQKVNEQTKELRKREKDLKERQKAILNILDDVEFEKNKSQALAADLEKFKLAVEEASDHVVITDKEGIILYANKAVERVTGYKLNEILGTKAGNKTSWGGFMSNEFYKEMWNTLKIAKQNFSGEIKNKRKDGTEYIAFANISPILNEKGDVVFFVGIERDITKEKEVDRMKTEFISLASHQLRTPLSAMKWFLEMLLDGDAGKLTSEQKEYIQNIDESNERMIQLVNSLLNVSRIESGKIIVDPKPTKLKNLVDDLLVELKPKIDEKEIDFVFSVAEHIPEINIDPKLISNVYQNLLTNAIKYTPKKGEVTVMISKSETEIISQVSDNGYGIPAKDEDKIFQKFFRADNAIEKDPEGNGLGLYLIKAIVETSDGKIWFESEEEKGTTFWFSLPLSGSQPKEGVVSIDS